MRTSLSYTLFVLITAAISLTGCKEAARVSDQGQIPYTIQAGKDYHILNDAEIIPVVGPQSQVKIYYFFKYRDLNCYKIEKFLQQWLSKKPHSIHLEYIPISTQASYLLRLHYTLAMIKNDAVPVIFRLLHQENENLSQDLNEPLLEKNHIDLQNYQTAKAFQAGIDHQISRGLRLEETYQVQNTSSLVVAGRYRINLSSIQNESDIVHFFKIVDALVAKVQKGEI